MTEVQSLLESAVADGTVPGAVALVARGGEVEVATAGGVDLAGTAPMTRDAIFRIASITKPITAVAALVLVEEGRIGLDEPITGALPELADPVVVRTPSGPLDDVVPARRPVTVADLLTFRAGWGFPSDFSLPAVALLFTELHQGPASPLVPEPDAWLARLARIPMLHQPGEAWLYNTCSDILGVLVSRISGQPLPEFLAERVLAPLGMSDTGFHVPPEAAHRLVAAYRPAPDGSLTEREPAAPADSPWLRPPAFPSGAGGLVSTADDWLAFGRMLLAGGLAPDGRRVLPEDSVRQLMTDQLTPEQRAAGTLFLEGQGWGFGGAVDVAPTHPWSVPGRYGWIGGTGTAAHVIPATGTVTVLLTQRELTGPSTTDLMRAFWRAAAG